MTSSVRTDIELALRDASTRGRLVVVTGAGISRSLSRADGAGQLPNWGELVQATMVDADLSVLDANERALLDALLPKDLLGDVDGDSLIEASQLVEKTFINPAMFRRKIAAICREEPRSTTDTHRAIAAIRPAGVITFNYDNAHEQAFKELGLQYEKFRYDEDDRICEFLASGEPDRPFLLKAHGSVERPESLVLTSASYRRVLGSHRPYRAFLQHILTRHCLLIAGFGLRDRDFGELMQTMEIEFGRPVQRHGFLTGFTKGGSKAARIERSRLAVQQIRFGLDPLNVADFKDIPDRIRRIGTTAGPLVERVLKNLSGDAAARRVAHDEIGHLGPQGRDQVRNGILAALADPTHDLRSRSEFIYSLGLVMDSSPAAVKLLTDEVFQQLAAFAVAPELQRAECVVHALLVLRRVRIRSTVERQRLAKAFGQHDLRTAMQTLDDWFEAQGEVRRAEAYAAAAMVEIEARSRAP